ncbi:hypothetical protein CVT25_004130 [Psilocybe cyanescens]|uniref:Tyrosinase copper-binding domain-containing protein n=1 Tax=Psilocybe cyanescens TaxID=93625 RepID=A0A409XKR0_PSICY|nr:hypothetical protein CVT25_004130 [Psilocybe cyanescens]
MIPRALYCLVPLCLASSIFALQAQVTKDSAAIGVSSLEEQDYVAFKTEEEYLEVEPQLSGREVGSGSQRPCRQFATSVLQTDETIKCLQITRALDRALPRKFHRFDEFTYAHSNVAEGIHGVVRLHPVLRSIMNLIQWVFFQGQFLPWHRHFGFLYEKALRECSYRGPFPYWDWTRDINGSFPLFSRHCLTQLLALEEMGWDTGPFANTVFHVGPNRRLSDHCLNRNFGEFARSVLSQPFISNIENQTTYNDYWNALDEPTTGDMASFYTSSNDPIFFLHHAGLDRLWWKWQQEDLENRLYQVGGRVNISPPYGEVMLEYRLPFDIISSSIRIRNTMDPRLEPYCYTY